jgi:hypothetical protein
LAWRPFSFSKVELLTMDEEVTSGTGLVYSTSPRTALDSDGETYFVKGPDIQTVFAELAGCVLAHAVGLTVPCAKACQFSNQIFAGTRSVSTFRMIEPYLRKPARALNHGEVFEAVVVDTWLANPDRNLGNIVGCPGADGKMEFVFIDFEKSTALRPSPRTRSTMIEAQELWPSDQLGNLLLDCKPLIIPMRTLQSIEQMTEDECNLLIQPISEVLGGVEWAADCAAALSWRARRIRQLAEEVWNCK